LYEEIRLFLGNLEVYGSWPTETDSNSATKHFVIDFAQSRMRTIKQLETCIRKLMEVIEYPELKRNVATVHFVEVDIKNLVLIFKKIYKVLRDKTDD
jgi:hypothetical protein